MSNVNSRSVPKPFEWLSGGLFFGNQNKGDDAETTIDSEQDVKALLSQIQDDLNTVESSPGNDKQSSSLTSSSSLAASLARLRFLLYNERRITTQQADNLNQRGTPSVALDIVENLSDKAKENTLRILIPELINYLQLLPFESRKHVAAIFNYLLVCGFDGADRDIYIPIMNKFRDYIIMNFEAIVAPIVRGHGVSSASSNTGTTTDVALHCGSMYRSCFRHSSLYGQLVVTRRRVEQFVFPFIDEYALLPNFDVSSDAMESLKLVMTAGTTCHGDGNNDSTAISQIDTNSQQEMAELAATFLIRDYDAMWDQRFNLKLLSTEANYMTKRVALQILSTVLLTRSNYEIMMKYVNSRTNLILVMKLLRDTSPHITLDAFHVFKVFVANPNKIPEVEKILRDNSQKLCAYLETLHNDKEESDQQFADEKRLIIGTIRDL